MIKINFAGSDKKFLQEPSRRRDRVTQARKDIKILSPLISCYIISHADIHRTCQQTSRAHGSDILGWLVARVRGTRSRIVRRHGVEAPLHGGSNQWKSVRDLIACWHVGKRPPSKRRLSSSLLFEPNFSLVASDNPAVFPAPLE